MYRTEAESWALFGGRLDPAALPAWADRELIDHIQQALDALGPFLSAGHRNSVRFGLGAGTGLRSHAAPLGDREFLCLLPVGLVVRVDYMIRLLERHAAADNVHVVDPDFYGDLPEEMKRERNARPLPYPLDVIGGNAIAGKDFWNALERMDHEDAALGRSCYRGIQIDQIRQAIMFCCLHEAAHALRNHHRIVKTSADPGGARRGAELDAEARAGLWIAGLRLTELQQMVPPAERVAALADSAWRITYAIATVLGLFDLDRLAIGDFSEDSYHHPAARLALVVDGMFRGFASTLGPEIVRRFLVESSAIAGRAYTSRASRLWMSLCPGGKCRRLTSIYFPVGDRLADLYARTVEEYDRFLTEYAVILESSVEGGEAASVESAT